MQDKVTGKPRDRHVLIVANRTAATPTLLAEVRRRALEGECLARQGDRA